MNKLKLESSLEVAARIEDHLADMEGIVNASSVQARESREFNKYLKEANYKLRQQIAELRGEPVTETLDENPQIANDLVAQHVDAISKFIGRETQEEVKRQNSRSDLKHILSLARSELNNVQLQKRALEIKLSTVQAALSDAIDGYHNSKDGTILKCSVAAIYADIK